MTYTFQIIAGGGTEMADAKTRGVRKRKHPTDR